MRSGEINLVNLQLDYVPVTFDGAVAEVVNALSDPERYQVIVMREFHFSFEDNLSCDWSLYDEHTPLRQDCRRRGLPNSANRVAKAILKAAAEEVIRQGTF